MANETSIIQEKIVPRYSEEHDKRLQEIIALREAVVAQIRENRLPAGYLGDVLGPSEHNDDLSF